MSFLDDKFKSFSGEIEYYLTQWWSWGVPCIPVRDKVPLVKGWPQITKFTDIPTQAIAKANGLAIITGERSGIICLDVDVTFDDSGEKRKTNG